MKPRSFYPVTIKQRWRIKAVAEAAKSFLGEENMLLARTKALSSAGIYWEKK
jgi:hypothetical protein